MFCSFTASDFMSDVGQRTFSIVDPATGEVVGNGGTIREDAIRDILGTDHAVSPDLIYAAARLISAMRDQQARADALDRRENEIAAREDTAFTDSVAELADSVAAIGRRLDALERARNQAKLDAAPDLDNPKVYQRSTLILPVSKTFVCSPTDFGQSLRCRRTAKTQSTASALILPLVPRAPAVYGASAGFCSRLVAL
jgi:hypothetical protein